MFVRVFQYCVTLLTGIMQDQTVKIAEARDLEVELQKLRDENADLRKRLNETYSLESAKKKAETRVEQLEQRASIMKLNALVLVLTNAEDG